jgi:hypothetical protein
MHDTRSDEAEGAAFLPPFGLPAAMAAASTEMTSA